MISVAQVAMFASLWKKYLIPIGTRKSNEHLQSLLLSVLSVCFRNSGFVLEAHFSFFFCQGTWEYAFFLSYYYYFFADNALLKIIRFCWDKNTAWLMNIQQSIDAIDWDVWLFLQTFAIILSITCTWATNGKKLQFYKDLSNVETMSSRLSY